MASRIGPTHNDIEWVEVSKGEILEAERSEVDKKANDIFNSVLCPVVFAAATRIPAWQAGLACVAAFGLLKGPTVEYTAQCIRYFQRH